MKANRKLTALTNVREYVDIGEISTLFKTFFESQFKYCLSISFIYVFTENDSDETT